MTVSRVDKTGIISPIPTSQGSTGAASFTAYGLIAGGANSSAALQSAGTGTLDQYYESAGNAALGTWKSQNQLGVRKLIQAQDITSSQATLDYTGLSSSVYLKYQLVISCIVPVTTNTTLQFLVSSDNGSNFDTGSGNYSWVWSAYPDSGTPGSNGGSSSSSATSITIATAFSNSNFNNSIIIELDNPAVSLNRTGPIWTGYYKNNSSVIRSINGAGWRLTSQVNDAFRLKFSSGDIALCYSKLYGFLAP
jgi:hypothetical protein